MNYYNNNKISIVEKSIEKYAIGYKKQDITGNYFDVWVGLSFLELNFKKQNIFNKYSNETFGIKKIFNTKYLGELYKILKNEWNKDYNIGIFPPGEYGPDFITCGKDISFTCNKTANSIVSIEKMKDNYKKSNFLRLLEENFGEIQKEINNMLEKSEEDFNSYMKFLKEKNGIDKNEKLQSLINQFDKKTFHEIKNEINENKNPKKNNEIKEFKNDYYEFIKNNNIDDILIKITKNHDIYNELEKNKINSSKIEILNNLKLHDNKDDMFNILEDKEKINKKISTLILDKIKNKEIEKVYRIHIVLPNSNQFIEGISNKKHKYIDLEFEETIININKNNIKDSNLFSEKSCDLLLDIMK
jgi:hypothetical protein